MTEEEYKAKYRISKRTIKKWLNNGWIRGAKLTVNKVYVIPDTAQKPYVHRSKKAKGIGLYKSLIRGISKGYDVFPELYGIHPNLFAMYMKELIDKGYVKSSVEEGIENYCPTMLCLESSALTDTRLMTIVRKTFECFSPIIEAASKGATSIVLTSQGM